MFNKNTITELNKLETPFYYYDLKLLQETLKQLNLESNKYNFNVHYALKANSNDKILKLISNNGLGADCVSGNEILKALSCGFPANKIAFAGVGKTDREINIGLENDIFSFNCESIPELIVINSLAKKQHKIAKIALRINPNVQANTHHYITTGLDENKFGINRSELKKVIELLNELKNIKLIGLHFHIGSQITDLSSFKGLCLRINEIQEWFINHHIVVNHINVGGGLGINYNDPVKNKIPNFKDYFKIFNDLLILKPNQTIHFELGRSIVGQSGTLLTRVLYIKEGLSRKFAILDAGMTDLLRPALYQAMHQIENLNANAKTIEKYDVVGPICESSDSFGKSVALKTTKRNDLLAIYSCGAYGEVMASRYNLRKLPKAVYSDSI